MVVLYVLQELYISVVFAVGRHWSQRTSWPHWKTGTTSKCSLIFIGFVCCRCFLLLLFVCLLLFFNSVSANWYGHSEFLCGYALKTSGLNHKMVTYWDLLALLFVIDIFTVMKLYEVFLVGSFSVDYL